MKPWIKQYRLIGRENRDQKKEIESLHSEIESLKRQDFVKMRHNLAAANARAEKRLLLPWPLLRMDKYDFKIRRKIFVQLRWIFEMILKCCHLR